MVPHKSMHQTPDTFPMAYFITLRTYGTWLPGDKRGFVNDRNNHYNTPRLSADVIQMSLSEAALRHEPMLLAAESAAVVEKTIGEVCQHREWRLYVAKARTNHVHIVVGAVASAERVMNDLKAWSTRRLREQGYVKRDRPVWAEHGSTPYLWSDEQLLGAIDYVKNWQGGPLQKTWDELQRPA
jgi:REP element-mobilizing transposase RayT